MASTYTSYRYLYYYVNTNVFINVLYHSYLWCNLNVDVLLEINITLSLISPHRGWMHVIDGTDAF